VATLGLAGPSWQRDTSPAYRAPAAWVLVLDLSPSMNAADPAPNRYTRARYAMDDLLGAARDVRVGLVVFSDEPYTVAPLTDDVATVRELLPPLAPAIMPSAGDKLTPALQQAASLLDQAAGRSRRVIVLTDGFSDPAGAFAAAEKLRSGGATVDVVGIGSREGAPLSDNGGGFSSDGQGHTRMTRLDVDLLQHLAASGGGRYADLDTLSTLLGELRNRAEAAGHAVKAADVTLERWRDGGVWLLPALLLLAALLWRRGWL
jgi:Ca-activated chloride channel family protein